MEYTVASVPCYIRDSQQSQKKMYIEHIVPLYTTPGSTPRHVSRHVSCLETGNLPG